MPVRLIVIIGAEMGGLAAGIYGRLNGYSTAIFERHILPGGQCTSLKRKGCTFDVCIHHLLGSHLNDLAPADSKIIREHIEGIKLFGRKDMWGEIMLGSAWGLLGMVPTMLASIRWFKPTMERFASCFSDPFLRRAFPLLECSIHSVPFFLHLMKHVYGVNGTSSGRRAKDHHGDARGEVRR